MYQSLLPLKRTYRYVVTINARNRGTAAEPVWEVWLTGAANAIQIPSTRYAMTPSQAIAYMVDVERAVYTANHAKHFSASGRAVICRFRSERIIH